MVSGMATTAATTPRRILFLRSMVEPFVGGGGEGSAADLDGVTGDVVGDFREIGVGSAELALEQVLLGWVHAGGPTAGVIPGLLDECALVLLAVGVDVVLPVDVLLGEPPPRLPATEDDGHQGDEAEETDGETFHEEPFLVLSGLESQMSQP